MDTNLGDNQYTIHELLFNTSYTDIGYDYAVQYYYPYIVHEDITNGKDRESLDTYIINATRINRSFGY